jgi:hypothetical protein
MSLWSSGGLTPSHLPLSGLTVSWSHFKGNSLAGDNRSQRRTHLASQSSQLTATGTEELSFSDVLGKPRVGGRDGNTALLDCQRQVCGELPLHQLMSSCALLRPGDISGALSDL